LTGGEPLVRKNIPDLARKLSSLPGLEDLSLSTNATRLGKYAHELKQAGVTRLNVSLDSLQPERYKKITKGNLDKVIKGLMAARDAGFKPIKINTVLLNDINLDEVESLVEFCIQHDFTLRFIETMPMGTPGVDAGQLYVNLQEVKKHLMNRYDTFADVMPGGGPARYIRIANTDLRIGFITPMSQHFCDTCNRVRMSVDGTLYMCLGQNHSFALRPLLRNGASDNEIKQAIRHAIELKPEKHEFNEKPTQVVRFMSMTGG
jgi:cyclic pyranopterin phosphate synthase